VTDKTKNEIATIEATPRSPLVRNLPLGPALVPDSKLSALNDKSIAKYREIYQKETGQEISYEEAAEQAQRFLNMARVVCQPMPKRFEKRYKEILREHLDNLRMDTMRPADGDQESSDNP